MAKKPPIKSVVELPTPATPPSGTTFRTRKDGTLMQKKCFWLEENIAHAFEVWCVVNRREGNEVVAELLRDFIAKKAP